MRFTIRDLLWLMVVVVGVVVWQFDRASLVWNGRVADAKRRLTEEKLNELGWRLKAMPSGREFIVEPIYRPPPSN